MARIDQVGALFEAAAACVAIKVALPKKQTQRSQPIGRGFSTAGKDPAAQLVAVDQMFADPARQAALPDHLDIELLIGPVAFAQHINLDLASFLFKGSAHGTCMNRGSFA